MDIDFNYYDASTGQISYYTYSEEQTEMPLKVGDKLVISVSQTWTNSDWSDWIDISSPQKIVEVLEVNNVSGYIRITTDIGISAGPPDETHTILEYEYIGTFILLIDEYKIVSGVSIISFGGNASGTSYLYSEDLRQSTYHDKFLLYNQRLSLKYSLSLSVACHPYYHT